MATLHSGRSLRPPGRTRRKQARTDPRTKKKQEHQLSGGAEAVVRREFRRLRKALSIAHCMEIAAERGSEIDLANVAAVISELLDKSLYEFSVAGLGEESLVEVDNSVRESLAHANRGSTRGAVR